jgi:hypothetical protein
MTCSADTISDTADSAYSSGYPHWHHGETRWPGHCYRHHMLSSVVRLVTMLMSVRRGTPTHWLVVILRASRHRLQAAIVVIVSLGLIKSMLRLLRMVLTSSLVRSSLIPYQLRYFLILELHIHSYLLVMFMQIVYLTLLCVDL